MNAAIQPPTNWRYLLPGTLMAFGLAIMAGWLLRKPFWQVVIHGTSPTFSTAFALAAMGASLFGWQRGTRSGVCVGRWLGALVALLGLLPALEHLGGMTLAADLTALHQWLADGNPWPGRATPDAALLTLAAGLALALANDEYVHVRIRRLLAALIVTNVVMALLALIFVSRPDTTGASIQNVTEWYRVPPVHWLIAVLFGVVGLQLFRLETPGIHDASSSRAYRQSDVFFGISLALLMTVSIVSYGIIKELQTRVALADDSYQVRIAIEELVINYNKAQAVWGRTIGSEAATNADIATFAAASQDANRYIDKLTNLMQNNPDGARRLPPLRQLLTDDLQFMQDTLQRKLRGEISDRAVILAPFREPHLHIEAFLQQMDAVRSAQANVLEQRRQTSQTGMRAATSIIGAGNATGFLLLLIAFWVLLLAQKRRSVLERAVRQTNSDLEVRIAERTQEVLHANRQLEVSNTTLEQRVVERSADLEAFSYSVSHDLRAPLRAIDGYALMLEEDHATQLDAEGKELLRKMRSYVTRMGNLVDDLLRLSKLGRQALISSPVDMSLLVQEVWQEVQHGLQGQSPEQGQGQTAVLELQPLPDCHGDLNLLRQVWINLISNAVKYSSRVEQPRIVISATQSAHETTYSIRDNGVGFDMAYADKLFGVFQRLHDQSTFSGTGVGLAIVHKVIRRHGGRVWANSALNQGATFHFSLPIQDPASDVIVTSKTWQ